MVPRWIRFSKSLVNSIVKSKRALALLPYAPGACPAVTGQAPGSRAQGDGMAVVYVLRVRAHHGYGLEGWRTVRKPSGEALSFETPEAAQAVLQQHFSNLRDGLNVRVHTMDAEAAQRPMPAVP